MSNGFLSIPVSEFLNQYTTFERQIRVLQEKFSQISQGELHKSTNGANEFMKFAFSRHSRSKAGDLSGNYEITNGKSWLNFH
jgi:hypothetical protein